MNKLEMYAKLIFELRTYCNCFYDDTTTREGRHHFHCKAQAVLNFAEKIGLIDFSTIIRFSLTDSIYDSMFDIKCWVDFELERLSHVYVQ